MKETRVRFAPSPTGALHIGGVRTALYNYLLAKKNKGTMILRIEDTDQSRLVLGAEEYIMKALDWAGIKIDEGVREGGAYGPYRQSERKPIYKTYAEKLVKSGHAYYAFDSETELEAMRNRQKETGSDQQQYSAATRGAMRNSLTLSETEVSKLLGEGASYVIRFKMPENKLVVLNDLIRGQVTFSTAQLDDKVLMKSDGMPTYHLANVVDDYLMKISHVIRGEEWLPSAPLHVQLYAALGWEKEMPAFAHLPLLLKPEGTGKLSKRDADRMGFPIFPLHWQDPASGEKSIGYKESGYLPEALINFLVLLGWNPGTEQEMFTLEEMISAFDLERINKSGAKFDIQKAIWFNQQYLRKKTDADLATILRNQLQEAGIAHDEKKLMPAAVLVRERISFPADLLKETIPIFVRPEAFDPEISSKKWNEEAAKAVKYIAEYLAGLPAIDPEKIRNDIPVLLEQKGIKAGKVMQALRLAITGQGAGPDLMKTIEILGKDEATSRLNHALSTLNIVQTNN